MLLMKATVSITGDMDDADFEGISDELEDTVEEALHAAKNYIASKLGQLGVGPIVVTVEM